jgi:hypothetical protein
VCALEGELGFVCAVEGDWENVYIRKRVVCFVCSRRILGELRVHLKDNRGVACAIAVDWGVACVVERDCICWLYIRRRVEGVLCAVEED